MREHAADILHSDQRRWTPLIRHVVPEALPAQLPPLSVRRPIRTRRALVVRRPSRHRLDSRRAGQRAPHRRSDFAVKRRSIAVRDPKVPWGPKRGPRSRRLELPRWRDVSGWNCVPLVRGRWVERQPFQVGPGDHAPMLWSPAGQVVDVADEIGYRLRPQRDGGEIRSSSIAPSGVDPPSVVADTPVDVRKRIVRHWSVVGGRWNVRRDRVGDVCATTDRYPPARARAHVGVGGPGRLNYDNRPGDAREGQDGRRRDCP